MNFALLLDNLETEDGVLCEDVLFGQQRVHALLSVEVHARGNHTRDRRRGRVERSLCVHGELGKAS